jgi:putative ABC transport system substrate-binding protein
MSSRHFIAVLRIFVAIWLIAAAAMTRADRAPRVARVGVLAVASEAASRYLVDDFTRSLRELGWEEGRNVGFERRYADAVTERLPALADELVGRKVDVILTLQTAAAQAAQRATSGIPIVFTVVADALGSGLVTDLARPSGNVTGLTSLNVELAAKRLEILRELAPKVRRVAVLVNRAASADDRRKLAEIERAAEALKLTVVAVQPGRAQDYASAFAAIVDQGADALMVTMNPINLTYRGRIVAFAAQRRLPAIHETHAFVDDGGLVSYAVHHPDQVRRAAAYVDKILRGASPGDLPVEQASRIELVLNLKAARELGLTVPQSVLIRADRVIE